MPVQNQPLNRDAPIIRDAPFVDRDMRRRNPDPVPTTSGRQAMWSALIALVIVVVMFGVFYDISDRTSQTASGSATTTAPQTTGQGNASQQGDR